MAKVIRSPKAEEDLLEIWSRIADDNIDAADRLLNRIAAAWNMLAENPLAGRTRQEFRENLRSLPVGDYVIFYRPITEGIEIVRVVQGSRDLPRLF